MKKYKTGDIYYWIDGSIGRFKVEVGQVFPTTPSRNKVLELGRMGNLFETYDQAKAMIAKISQTIKESRI